MPPYSFPRICHHKLFNRALYDQSIVADEDLLLHSIGPDRTTKCNLAEANLLPLSSVSIEDQILNSIGGSLGVRPFNPRAQNFTCPLYPGIQLPFPIIHEWEFHYFEITVIHKDPISHPNVPPDTLKRIIPIRGRITLTQPTSWDHLISTCLMDIPHYSERIISIDKFRQKAQIYKPLFYALYPFTVPFCASSFNTVPASKSKSNPRVFVI